MSGPSLIEVLELETIGTDLFQGGPYVENVEYVLYGGQVAARALRAAGQTVEVDRVPHSLHGYYLRSGDPAAPTVFRVERDRDGGSYSARRVVALQAGEVIFSMAASFARPSVGPDHQTAVLVPPATPFTALPEAITGSRLFSIESLLPEQPLGPAKWPARFWTRCTDELPDDPLLHACVLTYISDASTGLASLPIETLGGPSLDHAVWFHRAARMDEWTLIDLIPHTVAHRRGWYTGSVFSLDGTLVASLTQEAVFRSPEDRR